MVSIDSEEVRRSLGDELRRTREKAGLSKAELAALLHKSITVIEASERGWIRVTPRYAFQVAQACGRPELWMPTTIPPGGPEGVGDGK